MERERGERDIQADSNLETSIRSSEKREDGNLEIYTQMNSKRESFGKRETRGG